jgi:hypothetical protein
MSITHECNGGVETINLCVVVPFQLQCRVFAERSKALCISAPRLVSPINFRPAPCVHTAPCLFCFSYFSRIRRALRRSERGNPTTKIEKLRAHFDDIDFKPNSTANTLESTRIHQVSNSIFEGGGLEADRKQVAIMDTSKVPVKLVKVTRVLGRTGTSQRVG